MWFPWQAAVLLAGACVGLGFLARRHRHRWAPATSAIALETALVLVLYSIWQFAGSLSVMQADGAIRRVNGSGTSSGRSTSRASSPCSG